MKKLFVSVPMRDRTDENIRKSIDKMHKIAEVVFEQELEVLPSYNPENKNRTALEAIAESVSYLAHADYFIGVNAWGYKGCEIEWQIANSYNIPRSSVDIFLICPDATNPKELVECAK